MKIIITGGRTYQATPADFKLLSDLYKAGTLTEVVSGGAKGADEFGEFIAKSYNTKLTVFPADWNKHGMAAGLIRNKQMVEYADAVVLFPGGKGTANMKEQAEKMNLKIIYDGSEK